MQLTEHQISTLSRFSSYTLGGIHIIFPPKEKYLFPQQWVRINWASDVECSFIDYSLLSVRDHFEECKRSTQWNVQVKELHQNDIRYDQLYCLMTTRCVVSSVFPLHTSLTIVFTELLRLRNLIILLKKTKQLPAIVFFLLSTLPVCNRGSN